MLKTVFRVDEAAEYLSRGGDGLFGCAEFKATRRDWQASPRRLTAEASTDG